MTSIDTAHHHCEQRLREYLLTKTRDVRLRDPQLAADLGITADELRKYYEACWRVSGGPMMAESVVKSCLDFVQIGHKLASAAALESRLSDYLRRSPGRLSLPTDDPLAADLGLTGRELLTYWRHRAETGPANLHEAEASEIELCLQFVGQLRARVDDLLRRHKAMAGDVAAVMDIDAQQLAGYYAAHQDGPVLGSTIERLSQFLEGYRAGYGDQTGGSA
jgi:hypothetical protein